MVCSNHHSSVRLGVHCRVPSHVKRDNKCLHDGKCLNLLKENTTSRLMNNIVTYIV